jgi:hypothetical protein
VDNRRGIGIVMVVAEQLSSLQVVGLCFSIAGVIVTSIVLLVQTLIFRRQSRISAEQAALLKSQEAIAGKAQLLDVYEHATGQWAAMDEEVAKLFRIFPRTTPADPWDPALKALSPQEQDRWSLAQRTLDLECFALEHEHEEVWKDARQAAHKLVNLLSDFASYLDWGLLEIKPVMAKYHQAIIQRGWVLEPYLAWQNTKGDGARWGFLVLRLTELARIHHDLSRIQPRPISVANGETKLHWPHHAYEGLVYESKRTCFGVDLSAGQYRTAVHSEYPQLFLTDEQRDGQNLRMNQLKLCIEDLKRRELSGAQDVATIGVSGDELPTSC